MLDGVPDVAPIFFGLQMALQKGTPDHGGGCRQGDPKPAGATALSGTPQVTRMPLKFASPEESSARTLARAPIILACALLFLACAPQAKNVLRQRTNQGDTIIEWKRYAHATAQGPLLANLAERSSLFEALCANGRTNLWAS